MFNKNKKLIEKIVDIKEAVNQILLGSLVILFPLNQQYHFRPYPSVDGFIIDYLILKVSIPEILLFLIFFLNLKEIIKIVLSSKYYRFLFPFFVLLTISVIQSNYLYLALYENFLLILMILVGIYFFKNPEILNKKLLLGSVKFWFIFLTLLGSAQFLSQSSIFNNYALSGEFPYTEDYYHIKQKNIFFENLIPPYTVFSHSNIFGGYIIILFILLTLISGIDKRFLVLTLVNLILVGSVACILAFVVFLFSFKLKREFLMIFIKFIFFFSIAVYLIFSYRFSDFSGDFSIYRRLYMFDLSLNYFISNPLNFLFGSGYFNYFSIVKNDLYNYELVRFFQPPHFALNLIIWQYGFIFLSLIIFTFIKFFSKFNIEFLRLILVILILLSFDHYLITNHQFKVIFLILLPYSLKLKNSIK